MDFCLVLHCTFTISASSSLAPPPTRPFWAFWCACGPVSHFGAAKLSCLQFADSFPSLKHPLRLPPGEALYSSNFRCRIFDWYIIDRLTPRIILILSFGPPDSPFRRSPLFCPSPLPIVDQSKKRICTNSTPNACKMASKVSLRPYSSPLCLSNLVDLLRNHHASLNQ